MLTINQANSGARSGEGPSPAGKGCMEPSDAGLKWLKAQELAAGYVRAWYEAGEAKLSVKDYNCLRRVVTTAIVNGLHG